MATIKVNNVFMLSGQCACSWLAAQNCIIGLEAPRTYRQQGGGFVTKVNQTLVIISGDTLSQLIGKQWEDEQPGDTVCHPLSPEEEVRVTDFCKRVPIDA